MSAAQLDVYKEWLGIPEGPRPPDHYQLLRLVRFEDDVEKIRSNYKKLNAHVRKYATGTYSVESQELLNELAKAMLCLTDEERKREYDESLGREFADRKAARHQTLLDRLVEAGTISHDQAREVEEFADARGLSHRDAVVQMKLADAETATREYARELGHPYIDLADTLPDDAVLDQVPRALVKRNSIIPLFVDGDVVLVAAADLPSAELEDELRLRFGMPARFAIAPPRAIQQAIAKYYAPGMRDEARGAGKSSDAAPEAKPAPARRGRMAELSKEEQERRKQLGYIAICWSLVLCALFDRLVLLPMLGRSYPPTLFVTAFLIPPLVTWYVLKVYWR